MISKKNIRKFLLASSLGTFLEYLDFSLYAFSATIIAYHFFPGGEAKVALVKAWGVSFCGFLCRPFGAVFFGHVGDKYGPKISLLISMILMAISTTLIGFIPNYDSIGIWAPLLLMFCRMAQGFSFSAEYNGVASYLSLYKVKKNFGFYTSITIAVIGLGSLCGGLIMSAVTAGYTPELVPDINWRTPFIASGLLVGLSGVYLRRTMPSVAPAVKTKIPFVSVFKEEKLSLFLCVIIAGFVGLKSYSIFNFIPAFLQTELGLDLSYCLRITCYCNIAMMMATLLAGHLSDKYGRLFTINLSLLGMVVFSIVAFNIFQGRYNNLILPSMMGLSVASGGFSGAVPALFAEMFQEKQRFTGSALAYNVGVSVIGGSTPLVMTLLTDYTMMAPAYYICIYSFLVVAVFSLTKSNVAVARQVYGV